MSGDDVFWGCNLYKLPNVKMQLGCHTLAPDNFPQKTKKLSYGIYGYASCRWSILLGMQRLPNAPHNVSHKSFDCSSSSSLMPTP